MDPMGVNHVLKEITEEASINLPQLIELHVHRLRHTFGALYREKFSSDTETAAPLSHTGLHHVKRYVRKSQQERENAFGGLY